MDVGKETIAVPVQLPAEEPNAGNEPTFGPGGQAEQIVPDRNGETTDDTQPITSDVVRDKGVVAVGGVPETK